jgi:hypothetical protein
LKICFIDLTSQILYINTTDQGSECQGGDSCCTPDNKCEEDEGDCDADTDCVEGLKCGNRNCIQKSGLQWDSTDDCCYVPDDNEDKHCT